MQLKFLSFDGQSEKLLNIDKYPDTCPICHHKSIVKPRYFTYTNNRLAQICFQCVNEKCQNLFIGYYKTINFNTNLSLMGIRPVHFQPTEYPRIINECSPLFVKIVNQAQNVESIELDEITGVGYRKALEFLIKDYVTIKNPDKKDEIKKALLGNCINDYIDDPKIKACAERVVWLGNDETHYIRKWENKDINDLKVLIKLTVNWMESSLLTEDYLSKMTK